MTRTAALLACVAIAACPSATAAADKVKPRLHPLRAACIDYRITGMVSGTLRRCHRDFAYEQVELQDITIGAGGFSQTQRQRVLTVGDTIYTIDRSSNRATRARNPYYPTLVASMRDVGPDRLLKAYLDAMGFVPTGAAKTIAGFSCQVHRSTMLGSACLTREGLMLEQNAFGGVQTATRVSVGDMGGDADYDIPAAAMITERTIPTDLPGSVSAKASAGPR